MNPYALVIEDGSARQVPLGDGDRLALADGAAVLARDGDRVTLGARAPGVVRVNGREVDVPRDLASADVVTVLGVTVVLQGVRASAPARAVLDAAATRARLA